MKIIKNFDSLYDFYYLLKEGDILNYKSYKSKKLVKYIVVRKHKISYYGEIKLTTLIIDVNKSSSVLRYAFFSLDHVMRTEIIKL